MKHETTLYRGDAAVAYARRNLGAYLVADGWLEALIGGKHWGFENDTETLQEVLAEHGTEGFTLRGGISDAHDEAFFFWLMRQYDHLRSRMFSTDFSGTLDTTFDDKNQEDVGVDLDLISLEDHTDVSSVTLESIGLRLAREGKVRALEVGFGYEFALLGAPPLKVWAVLASSKENAIKALEIYEPAVVVEDDFFGITFDSPTGRLESACRIARVKFKGVHALRHAAGTRLRDETGDLALVADHLRHTSLDTARGYAKASNQQLKKAVGEW